MNDEKESKTLKWAVVGAVAITGITALWVLSWALITYQLGNLEKQGQFGDMFGAVNALFSGLAFAGVIVAILMQQEELKIQRKELTQSRYAQEGQAKALLMAAQLEANIALFPDENSFTLVNVLNEYDPDNHLSLSDWRKERLLDINRLRLELAELITKLATDKTTNS